MKFEKWFDALWRVAILAALCWIAWGLQQLHADLKPAADETATTAAAPPEEDPLQEDIAGLRDEVALLTQKVDAILVVMARSR